MQVVLTSLLVIDRVTALGFAALVSTATELISNITMVLDATTLVLACTFVAVGILTCMKLLISFPEASSDGRVIVKSEHLYSATRLSQKETIMELNGEMVFALLRFEVDENEMEFQINLSSLDATRPSGCICKSPNLACLLMDPSAVLMTRMCDQSLMSIIMKYLELSMETSPSKGATVPV